jgi:hypothetical protein
MHEMFGGHQTACIQIFKWLTTTYQYVCEMHNFQIKTNQTYTTKSYGKTHYIGLESIRLKNK